jgi:hypothetical protein
MSDAKGVCDGVALSDCVDVGVLVGVRVAESDEDVLCVADANGVVDGAADTDVVNVLNGLGDDDILSVTDGTAKLSAGDAETLTEVEDDGDPDADGDADEDPTETVGALDTDDMLEALAHLVDTSDADLASVVVRVSVAHVLEAGDV